MKDKNKVGDDRVGLQRKRMSRGWGGCAIGEWEVGEYKKYKVCTVYGWGGKVYKDKIMDIRHTICQPIITWLQYISR